MKKIDLTTWPRTPHFKFFKTFDQPFFDVAARVDVTDLVEFVDDRNASLFATLMHCALRAANDTKNLRYRFRDDDVFEIETNHASFTVLGDDETFNYATALFDDDLDLFSERVQEAAEANQNLEELYLEDDHRLDLIYVTCMPWLDFQSISHPMSGLSDDCAPRIAWGKVVEIQTDPTPRWEVTVQLTIHHSLADGLHAAQFFSKLKTLVSHLETEAPKRRQS